jgi:hypothetical protein
MCNYLVRMQERAIYCVDPPAAGCSAPVFVFRFPYQCCAVVLLVCLMQSGDVLAEMFALLVSFCLLKFARCLAYIDS